jgi:hypothetical protein
MPGIKRVGVKHEAILNFLLAHPNVRMREVASHFQVSQPWLSLIIHSDAFQRKLRERQDIHFHTSILPMMQKVECAADLAIDRMLELIPLETDLGKLNQVADKALTRLGYGTSSSQTQVNVQVNVDRSMLERARSLIGGRAAYASGVALEGVTSEDGPAGTLQAGEGRAVGEDYTATALPYLEANGPETEAGGSV